MLIGKEINDLSAQESTSKNTIDYQQNMSQEFSQSKIINEFVNIESISTENIVEQAD